MSIANGVKQNASPNRFPTSAPTGCSGGKSPDGPDRFRRRERKTVKKSNVDKVKREPNSWLWPDRTISKRESRQLREEHNALVNEYAELLKFHQDEAARKVIDGVLAERTPKAKSDDNSASQAKTQLESIREMVAALKAKRDAEEKDDDELEAISSDPLSVEVRSRWMELRDWGNSEQGQPEEFKILLCTGGPAVQIVGDLDNNNEPERVRLQHQDWGTPWTDYPLTAEDEEVLLEYCRQFYFGE